MSALKGESQRGVKGFASVVNTENKTPKTVRQFKVKKVQAISIEMIILLPNLLQMRFNITSVVY